MIHIFGILSIFPVCVMVPRSMNVFFVGQTSVLGQSAREQRIRALARQLAHRNHQVMTYSATEKHIRRSGSFGLRAVPSFDPSIPGGWLYTILSLLRGLGKKTDVVHMHGWKAAALMPLAALTRPQATFVWTVDTLPGNHRFTRRLTVWLAARLCDAITVPTRDLQYRFRLKHRVLAAYVPDGYETSAIKDIPASHWKLRKDTYTLVVVDDAAALRKFCLAYKDTKKRKKVVVLVRTLTRELERLGKRYTFVRFIETTSNRQRSALIRQAGQVIFLAANSTEFLLAMDTATPLLAASHPLLQELAGTTVQFFHLRDRKHLAGLLQEQPASNRKTSIRARAHFTWQRVFEEYETLYHYPKVLRVPVDSVRPSRTAQAVTI